MSKEKQIQEYENKQLINELLKMPSQVLAMAYLYAVNFTLYGEDVIEKWETVIENTRALESAYKKGYYDALHRQAEREENNMEIVIKIPEDVKNRLGFGITYPKDIQVICEALNDGIPLPQGHGRIKDIDKIISDGLSKGFCDWYNEMDYADTIIEANKE